MGKGHSELTCKGVEQGKGVETDLVDSLSSHFVLTSCLFRDAPSPSAPRSRGIRTYQSTTRGVCGCVCVREGTHVVVFFFPTSSA